jgi:7-carboxy-7-deazaguanine synthase
MRGRTATPMTYTVKEIFLSFQGEGARTGRPAVFCRFAGCNLWNGREHDRARALCRFCDTDFVGTSPDGGKFPHAEALAQRIDETWPTGEAAAKYLVLTGGEPALQADEQLVEALHRAAFEVAIETNGTIALPGGLDWVCVSPKARTRRVVRRGDELKLVYPQRGLNPDDVIGEDFEHFSLQPMDGPDLDGNTRAARSYCRADPRWQLSIQTHKLVGAR